MEATRKDSLRSLATWALVIIIIAGLKLSRELVVPIVFAAFLAILCLPVVTLLRRRGLPAWLAIVLTLVLMIGLVGLVGVVVVDSMSEFARDLPAYQARLDGMIADLRLWLEKRGVELSPPKEPEALDFKVIFGYARTVAGTAVNAFSAVALVLLMSIFMLFESVGLPNKLRRTMGDPDADLSQGHEILKQVYGYVGVKTVISAMTGLLFGIALTIIGVPNAVLWGFLAFILNYIPNIGSVLSAIPPILVGLAAGGMSMALGALAANVVINQVIGNVIEPKVTGDRLGLSALVVFLSLVFWSWLWGPVGMFLSVPLTMVVEILLENSGDLKRWADLLGPAGDPEPVS